MNGSLYIVDKATGKLTTYLDFNGRDGRPGVFHKFSFDGGWANGLNSFQFDPDYSKNGKFYTVHIEDPTVDGSGVPDNARSPGLTTRGYATTAAITTPGDIQREGVLVEWTDSNPSNDTFEGTAREVMRVMRTHAPRGAEFDVASNPEFLREGAAIETFMRPDRVVIGAETKRAADLLKKIYDPLFLTETPMVVTTLETAELIKYAANCFLATKISFINEIANLCEGLGADVRVVAKGVGMDRRIGSKFLHAGPGYGGSCFPKDTYALVSMAKGTGEHAGIVAAVIAANERQAERMVDKIQKAVGRRRGARIAVLGLAFKPNTGASSGAGRRRDRGRQDQAAQGHTRRARLFDGDDARR